MSVVRFGVSFEKEVLDALDEYVGENKFANRSQALRQLVNRHIVEKKWLCNNQVAGAVTLVYDHHKREIASHLAEIQRSFKKEILSVQRFTLNDHHSMEVISILGISSRLTDLSEKLISEKGIQHGKLTMSRMD
ncbi:MAG: nickel-responsive transcriptional regulator NikR [Bacteroidetes bacterium]|nr:MAG: nickel-responsive transcriptional regulator NikR [Bacteroidota bacterium]